MVKIAECLIFTRLLKVISNPTGENGRSPESCHFRISTAIFAAMLANPTGEHHQRRQSSSNEAPAVASHPVQPAPPLGIARRVGHPQQGLADRPHPGEFEDTEF